MLRAALQSAFQPALRGPMAASSGFFAGSLFSAGEQGVWYDPSDLSTLFQDSAGTTPVTAVGQPVGLMLDKSGRGNHAIQATSTKRAVYQVDGNGRAYLSFDGIDDSYATGSIDFTATDKMTVVAGVRKLSDAGTGVACEMGPASNVTPATFGVLVPSNGGANPLSGWSGGTTSVQAASGNTTYAAPKTAVITMSADIAAPSLAVRLNGVLDVSTAVSQGTGNYANYPLYIGSRGAGITLPFNGNLYGLIIRGAASSAAQIASAEAFVNSKTGAY